MSDPQSHEEFTRVWRAEAPHVLAFATRHVGPGLGTRRRRGDLHHRVAALG